MKYIFTASIFLLNLSFVFGQRNNEGSFLKTKGKSGLYYVELNSSGGTVFEMGIYLDKAGLGHSIRSTDTITRQADQTHVLYLGKRTKIINDREKLYLVVQNNKTSKYELDSSVNPATVTTNLNNAYYLDNFFSMCNDLNKAYPLNHYSFRNGFYSWKELNNKEINHSEFQKYANSKLQEIKDSISKSQNQYVALTNHIIQNIKTIDYDSLKNGLTNLPAEFKSTSWYFRTVINEVSKQRPEYFFRLAEDFPNSRNVIFMAVEDNKQVIQNLKSVENHNEIKKEFFKDRRFDKSMPYKIGGAYAIVIGLITLLIISQ